MSGRVVLHSVFLNSIFPCLLENLPPFIRGKAWIMPGLMQTPGLVQQQKTRFLRFPPWESRERSGKFAGLWRSVCAMCRNNAGRGSLTGATWPRFFVRGHVCGAFDRMHKHADKRNLCTRLTNYC